MSCNVLTVSSDTYLAEVADDMVERNVSCAVVLEGGKIVGIVSEHDFLKTVSGECGELLELHVSDAMSRPVQSIGPEQTTVEAGRMMEAHRIRRLPVVNGGQLVGVVTQTDLLQAVMSMSAHKSITGIMNTDVPTISVHSTVVEASGTMDRHHVSCVVAERAGAPVGILSERDILRKVMGARKDPKTQRVGDIMSTPMVSVEPSCSIFSAARLLDQKHIRRLAVMDEERLCGIVTQADILTAAIQELQEREQARLQRLNESSTMVFMLDAQCRTTYCNPAFLEFLAVDDPGEIISQPFLPERFWIKPDERSCFIERVARGIIEPEELELKTALGDRVSANIFCTITQDQGSEGVLHDITLRKQGEQALAAALEETERANHELKAMQSQLVQNEKLACIGQIAAGVAHEMNTPVGFVASNFETLETYVDKLSTIIKSYDDFVDLVRSSDHTELSDSIGKLRESRQALKLDFVLEDIQNLFTESREGLTRVTSIVQNLRDFSRIDQSQEKDDHSLNDCIKSTLIVAKNEIKYDAEIETDLAELPLISCHAGQINQVLLNILVNAAHAIKSQPDRQGKGKIVIKTYAIEDNVVCEIQDNGPGIPQEMLSRIFDPFFTTKPVGKGTGLGLSVSHDIIVNKHHGQLDVYSTVGCGTTFTVRLPVTGKYAAKANAICIEERHNGETEDNTIC